MASSNKRRRPARTTAVVAPESSRSIAATVGWMLATLTTLVGIVAVAGLLIAAGSLTPNESSLLMLSRLLLFASAISGLTSLVLLAVTWKVRQIRPPLAIVVFSVLIAITPLVGVAVVVARL